MTKGNWVGSSNAQLDQTNDWANKKNMAKSMRWADR
jgi:hypothetical protein